MKEYHPDSRVLERFVRGVASPPEAQLVVRHLLTRCPRCRAVVQELAQELAGPGWARDSARAPREAQSTSERKE